MVRLLILTNSADGTTDNLLPLLDDRGVGTFRWNIDLWSKYDLVFSDGQVLLKDPVGREISPADHETLLLWRKPFTSLMTFDHNIAFADQEVACRQIAEWMRAIVSTMKRGGRVRLIEPYADQRLPKLLQLHLAAMYFKIPQYIFSIISHPEYFSGKVITKPLGDPSVGHGQILFTSLVDDPNSLHRPYPWFLQRALIGGHDVTCVFINGTCHFFKCEFVRAEETVDWRVEINTEKQSAWHPIVGTISAAWSELVRKLMADFGLHYGRLDFILHKDELYFLECNSNGQFGWLDDLRSLYLHCEFADAILDVKSQVA